MLNRVRVLTLSGLTTITFWQIWNGKYQNCDFFLSLNDQNKCVTLI